MMTGTPLFIFEKIWYTVTSITKLMRQDQKGTWVRKMYGKIHVSLPIIFISVGVFQATMGDLY